LTPPYTYISSGTGVNVYVIDTGIWLAHQEFGGRAFAAYDYFRNPSDCQYGYDCVGHGSHVAGIIGGSTYGVAKNVTLYSVRVFDCTQSGSTSSLTSGIDWVTAYHINPAVANMSFGGTPPSDVLDTATRNAIASGVTCVVGAANGTNNDGNPIDAIYVSPARVEEAITVGATEITDYRDQYSNFGSIVDVFAPGTAISTTIGSFNGCQPVGNANTEVRAGTSIATLHVAGAAARYLQNNPNATPSMVQQWIVNNATVGNLRDHGASFSQDVPYDNSLTNYSLSLNGIDGYVNVPSSASLNVTGAFTVEAWVKLDSLMIPQQGVAERYNSVPGVIDGGFALRLVSNKIQFWSMKNGWDLADGITGNNAITNFGWHHIAGVFDGNQLRVYLDGVLDNFKSSTFTPGAGTASLKIGARGDDAAYKFKGLIDE